MASIEPEIEFGVDEITLREQVQSKLAGEAASWKGGSLSSTGAGSLSTSMIGGVDTSGLYGPGMAQSAIDDEKSMLDFDPYAMLRIQEWQSWQSSGGSSDWNTYADTFSPEQIASHQNNWIVTAMLPSKTWSDWRGTVTYGAAYLKTRTIA